MGRTLCFSLVLLMGAGCSSDRRRTVGDGSVVGDSSVPEDSGLELDADTDSGAAMDSARPPVDSAVDSAAPRDSGARDSGPADTGVRDTGVRDTGVGDTGTPPRDTGPPGVTIEDIQRGTVAPGTTVTLSNMSVTGIFEVGAWVQDPALGPAYSGIRVYVGVRPTVSLGDRVDITGSVLEYFGDTEIEATSFTRLGAGTAPAPVPVTVSQALTEAYEGVLVRITDGASFAWSYDCTLDNPACSDTDIWVLSSSSSEVLVHDYAYEDVDWLSRIGSLRVTGIMSYRYDNRRLLPRFSADLSP